MLYIMGVESNTDTDHKKELIPTMDAGKKEIPYYILQVLKEYSDEDHLISAPVIRQICERDHDLIFERRTLYNAINMLRSFGYDIHFVNNGIRQGYYLDDKSRLFSESEVLLLSNAIHASHFIPAKQSTAIINKLLSIQSRNQRNNFTDNVYLPNQKKTGNEELLANIRAVSEAIRERKTITFCYLHYEFDHLQHKNDGGKIYTAEPRYIVYHDSRGYVLVTQNDHPGLITYRLDRMTDVRVTENKAAPFKEADNTDAYSLVRNQLFMFSGREVKATLHCKDRILDAMLDIFGPQAKITNHKDGYFDLHITSPERGLIYLAQQYMDAITIKEPQETRDHFIQSLEAALQMYQKEQ